MTDVILELDQVSIRYNESHAIDNLSLRIRKGSMTCLLGPSGCGKSTLLRAIAGLQSIHTGEIRIDGQTVSAPGKMLAAEKRHVGMVFQDYALFPHLDTRQNICFSLNRLNKTQQNKIADELMQLTGILDFADQFPHELSGGQQQRVALARALAANPRILLLDEPFSNLDTELRERLSTEVRDILLHKGITSILVTHDQTEAFAVADQIAVLKQGNLQQWDTAYNLYHDPANQFVADFIGQGAFIPGTLVKPDTINTELGDIQGDRAYSLPIGSRLDILVRPDDICPDSKSSLKARVVDKSFKGAQILYTLQLITGSKLIALFPSHNDHQIDEVIGITSDVHHLIAFPTT